MIKAEDIQQTSVEHKKVMPTEIKQAPQFLELHSPILIFFAFDFV
jgi:hypothetical protein